MSSACNANHSFQSDFLDSPRFLSTTLHIICAVSIPIHLFGMYVILSQTPETMKSVKWYLASLHISTVLFDYSISIMTIPVIMFPEFAGYPLGLFRLVNEDYYVYPVVLTIFLMGCKLSFVSNIQNQAFRCTCIHYSYF